MNKNIINIGCNDGGFFSNCNVILMTIIKYFNDNKRLPYEIITSDMFRIYKSYDSQNIYDLFFYVNNDEITYKKNIVFNDELYENQFSDYKLLKLMDVLPFFNKYFCPRQFIYDNISKLLDKYEINIDDDLCGVFYRGNDKVKETQKPPYDEVILKAKKLKEKNSNIKFIVQTDEREFLNYFLEYFPDTIYFTEVDSMYSNISTNVSRLIPNNEKINHITNFLSIIIIFSKLKYLITTSGNCEIFIVFFRNNTNNLFQYLKKNKYIHGTINKEYDENNFQVWY
jgi:hypothetical protein